MPKLADAWVELSTKDASLTRGLGAARKEVEGTASAFTRGTSIMVRSAERPYRAMRRIFNIFKEVAKQTEDGKFAVENADKAWGGLVNQLIAIVTNGENVAIVFDVIASAMRMLTKGTDDYQMALLSVQKQLLRIASVDAKFFGALPAALAQLLLSNNAAIRQQIADIEREIKERNNDMTKNDVANAQKRVDAAKKEHDAKRTLFLGLEELWKEAQRRMNDQEAKKLPQARKPFAPINQPARTNHEILEEERKRNRPRKFSELTPEEQKGWLRGASHEEIDRLKHSGDPEKEKHGYRMEQSERENNEAAGKGPAKRIDPDEQDKIDAAKREKIKQDTNEFLDQSRKDQVDKLVDMAVKTYEESVKQRAASEKILLETKKKTGVYPR